MILRIYGSILAPVTRKARLGYKFSDRMRTEAIHAQTAMPYMKSSVRKSSPGMNL